MTESPVVKPSFFKRILLFLWLELKSALKTTLLLGLVGALLIGLLTLMGWDR